MGNVELRRLINKGYSVQERRAVSGRKDKDGRPVAIYVLQRPSRSAR